MGGTLESWLAGFFIPNLPWETLASVANDRPCIYFRVVRWMCLVRFPESDSRVRGASISPDENLVSSTCSRPKKALMWRPGPVRPELQPLWGTMRN